MGVFEASQSNLILGQIQALQDQLAMLEIELNQKATNEDVVGQINANVPAEIRGPSIGGDGEVLVKEGAMAGWGMAPDEGNDVIPHSFACTRDGANVKIAGGSVTVVKSMGATTTFLSTITAISDYTVAFVSGQYIYIEIIVSGLPEPTYTVNQMASGALPSSSGSLVIPVAYMYMDGTAEMIKEIQTSNAYVFGGLIPDGGDEYMPMYRNESGEVVWDWLRAH